MTNWFSENLSALVPMAWDTNPHTTFSSWSGFGIERQTWSADGTARTLFIRPSLRYPFGMTFLSFGTIHDDGKGGMWCRINVPKGIWEQLWDDAALNSIA